MLFPDASGGSEVTSFHMAPVLFVRTGPGLANDGKPKFDLTKVNPVWLKRLHERIVEAGNQGIYVGVMLFEPINYGIKRGKKPPPEQRAWYVHPFHRNNNINGIDGDSNNDGEGWEISTLSTDTFYSPPVDSSVTAVQERYVEAVIDALHDLDNIIWEIGNESILKSDNWQNHLIEHIKGYEKQKGYQRHLVWKTAMDDLRQGQYVNKLLFNSPADVISPNGGSGGQDYRANPPAASGNKIIIADTDHLWGVGGDVAWVWKSFTRGIHPIFMDPHYGGPWKRKQDPSVHEPVRNAMGHAAAMQNGWTWPTRCRSPPTRPSHPPPGSVCSIPVRSTWFISPSRAGSLLICRQQRTILNGSTRRRAPSLPAAQWACLAAREPSRLLSRGRRCCFFGGARVLVPLRRACLHVQATPVDVRFRPRGRRATGPRLLPSKQATCRLSSGTIRGRRRS